VSIRIREQVDPMIAFNRAKIAARVARKARVADGIDVAGAHPLTCFEARGNRHISSRGRAVELFISR